MRLSPFANAIFCLAITILLAGCSDDITLPDDTATGPLLLSVPAAPVDVYEPMTEIPTTDLSPFGITDTNTWDSNYTLISRLNDFSTPTSLEEVAADTNHSGAAFSESDLLATQFPEHLQTGFYPDIPDQQSCWRPQGITGTGDAYPATGKTTTGLKLLAIGSHDDNCVTTGFYPADKSRGVEVTFTDVTHMDDIKYRKVLLVEPYEDEEGAVNFRIVDIHAGGMSWVGQYLYVVDTLHGLRVFDVMAMLKVDTTSDGNKTNIGIVNGKAFAYGFKYIMPQVGGYEPIPNPAAQRFSWISLDSSTDPKSFITGEYATDRSGRVFRWSLNADDKLQVGSDNIAVPCEAFNIKERDVQGGFSRLIGESHKYWFTGKDAASKYYLFRKTTAEFEKKYWWSVRTAQNLSYSPFSDNLWCLQEFPLKPVWAVKLSDLSD